MVLSLVILTIPERREKYLKVLEQIAQYSVGLDVELILDSREGLPIGQKRGECLERCTGEYVFHIDDDDEITEDFFTKFLEKSEQKPDVIGITEEQYFMGEFVRLCSNGGSLHEFQMGITPRCFIKTELAKQVGFYPLSECEDTIFGTEFREYFPDYTHDYIDDPIYKYMGEHEYREPTMFEFVGNPSELAREKKNFLDLEKFGKVISGGNSG